MSILHCLALIDRTMIAGILPLMRPDIAMDDAQAGWILGTAFALPYGITALALAAVLRGRRGSIWCLAGGVSVWTAASMATGVAQSLTTLTIARAGLGVGQALFVPVAIASIIGHADPARRARALATFTSGSTIGRSTSLIAIGALLSLLGWFARDQGMAHWRWLFVLTALPNLVILPLLIGLRIDRTPTESPGHVLRADDAHATAINWRTLTLFFMVAIMPVLLGQAISAWLPTLFVRERGLSPSHAATLLGAITLFAAPSGQILGGWLMNRHATWHGEIPVLVLAGVVTALVPLATIVWAPTLVGAAIGVAAVNLALGVASFCGLFGVQIATPRSSHITVNGIYLAFATLVAVGVGPLLAGALAVAGGNGGNALGIALIGTGGIVSILCALAVVAVQRRYRRGLVG